MGPFEAMKNFQKKSHSPEETEKGDRLGFFNILSQTLKKMKGFPLASPVIVCYAGKRTTLLVNFLGRNGRTWPLKES